MQKHNSQPKVIYTNMFVCLYGCLSQSLPFPLVGTCICCFVVICVIGGRAMGVFMCVVFVCCVRKIPKFYKLCAIKFRFYDPKRRFYTAFSLIKWSRTDLKLRKKFFKTFFRKTSNRGCACADDHLKRGSKMKKESLHNKDLNENTLSVDQKLGMMNR